MQYLNDLSHFAQGYFWATVLFPVEYYLLKPVAIKVWADVQMLWTKYVSKGKTQAWDDIQMLKDSVKNAI